MRRPRRSLLASRAHTGRRGIELVSGRRIPAAADLALTPRADLRRARIGRVLGRRRRRKLAGRIAGVMSPRPKKWRGSPSEGRAWARNFNERRVREADRTCAPFSKVAA